MHARDARFPRGICLLRLSAIGDVAHALAVVEALRQAFPGTPLTWVVGRLEAEVARLAPGVEIVAVDKRRPLSELRRLRRELAGRRFDALLHMQVAFRASLVSLGVPASRRIGFDRARAWDGQHWFTTERVAPAPARGEHVAEGLMRFAAALGAPARPPRWQVTLPPAEVAWAAEVLPRDRRVLAISPCASRAVREWPAERQARLAAHAVRRHGLHVVLIGGASGREKAMARQVAEEAGVPVQDLVGQTSLPRVMAVLARCIGLVSPDSGPVHLANALSTPVIGLYAVSNLHRTGPYLDRRWCVDRRQEAALRFRGRSASELGWNEAIAEPGVMALIPLEEVCAKLDVLVAARASA